jgi:PKD repeat protein
LGSFNKTHWAFGDGNTSTFANPNHTFSANGTYVVVLTINDSTIGSSCIDYFLETIIVTGVVSPLQCNAGFTMYPAAGNVTVINSSTGTNLSYLWDFGDGNTSTVQFPTHTYATAGPFYICLTVDDGAGCNNMYCDSIGQYGVVFNKQNGFTINVISPIVIGIENILALNTEVRIFPNPTSNQLSIDTDLEISVITILDLTGKMILTTKQNTKTLSVADLSNGIYFIKLVTDEGTITKKFVKQ